jgi:hypothetical protein
MRSGFVIRAISAVADIIAASSLVVSIIQPDLPLANVVATRADVAFCSLPD